MRTSHPPQASQGQPASKGRQASQAYQQGNAHFSAKRYPNALAYWRQAAALWQGHPPQAARPSKLSRKQLLCVALGFVAIALLVHVSLYVLFPRPPAERRALANTLEQSTAPWWQKWLETGRPSLRGQASGSPSLGEWWRNLPFGQKKQARPQAPPGLSLEERWRNLILERLNAQQSTLQPLNRKVVAGFGLSQRGEYAVAVEVLIDGLDKTNHPLQKAELWQTLANVHYAAAQHLQLNGMATYNLALIKKAAWAYQQALEYVVDPIGLGNIGWMYYLLGDYAKAQGYSLRALAQNPQLQYVQCNLGLAYIAQRKYEKALEVYQQVLEQIPSLETLHGGINDLQEMLRDHPQRWSFANLPLAMLALQAGNPPLAAKALHALEQAPQLALKWRSLGRVLQRRYSNVMLQPNSVER